MNAKANILLVDDDAAFRQVMSFELRRLGHEVTAAATGEEAVRICSAVEPEVILLDLCLPGIGGLATLKAMHERNPSIEILMLTGHGSIDTAIESIREGAFDYVVKPCPLDELQVRIQRALERRELCRRANLLERGLTPPDLAGSFVGQSPQFTRLMRLVDRVAPTESTVLITGETGSGKERVAKLIHSGSKRRDKPFVVVDCAVLQESLMASELFGHERGAFTGAEHAKPGLFEVAHGGTIFLDEIGEVSPAIQTKLLRVLDTSAFRRVGGNAEVRVDVRVLAATNRELSSMVRQGQFREDLYYRMSTITLEVPSLRNRGEDIVLLVQHFVAVWNERFQSSRRISESALEACRRHTWPGNVRELMHAIESAMVVCEGPEILPEHLPPTVFHNRAAARLESSDQLPTLDDLERSHIRRVLETCNGHRENAARILGISERNLYRKIHELGM